MLRKDPPGGGGGLGGGPGRLFPDRAGNPGPGRRPLLSTFEGNNRQMLMGIKDSLHHHIAEKFPKVDGDQLGGKSELSHSTPNLLDSSSNNGSEHATNGNNNAAANNSNKNMTRLQYNKYAMAQIQKSLHGYEVHDNGGLGSNHCYIANGMDIEVTPVNKKMLQQLMSMGADEVSLSLSFL